MNDYLPNGINEKAIKQTVNRLLEIAPIAITAYVFPYVALGLVATSAIIQLTDSADNTEPIKRKAHV